MGGPCAFSDVPVDKGGGALQRCKVAAIARNNTNWGNHSGKVACVCVYMFFSSLSDTVRVWFAPSMCV